MTPAAAALSRAETDGRPAALSMLAGRLASALGSPQALSAEVVGGALALLRDALAAEQVFLVPLAPDEEVPATSVTANGDPMAAPSPAECARALATGAPACQQQVSGRGGEQVTRWMVPVQLAGGGIRAALGCDAPVGADAALIEPALALAATLVASCAAYTRADRERAQLHDRFQSFIASNVEAVFCYELQEPVPEDLPADQLFERFLEARLVICNQAYATPRGAASPEALYGRTMRELALAPLDRLRELLLELLRAGNREEGAEIKQVRPDGTVRWALTRGNLVRAGGNVVRLWVTLRDVTEERQAAERRKVLEANLQTAQRMESIGLLAGGIAHDFNNVLVAISGFAEIAQAELATAPEAAAKALAEVRAAAARAAELTRNLLTFGRRHTLNPEPLDVGEVIDRLLPMVRRLIRGSVQIELRKGGPTGTIRGDRGQIEQLVVNLCVNAADAIQDVGRITIELEPVVLDEAAVRPHPPARPGRYTRLVVADTGVGMTSEVRQRIFEPFFTTKGAARGTGLGLAIVYGVVKEHEGLIEVDSVVGKGTTFRVCLPESPAPAVRPEPEPVTAAGGGETILLAEDHDMVRNVARRFLERAGYRVILAADGQEALTLFDRHEAEIDLALLDAVMPLVSGHAVLQHIAARRPELPIIVASGYSTGVFPDQFFTDNPEIAMLSKPYPSDTLLRRVRQSLDEAAAQRRSAR